MKAGFGCEIKECKKVKMEDELNISFKKLPYRIMPSIFLVFWSFVFVSLHHLLDIKFFIDLFM